MRKLLLVAVASILFAAALEAAPAAKQAKPKYIFYFIGDGMGVASMYTTDRYLQQKNSGESLLFNHFPYTGIAYTYSTSSEVTDSAAAGTALACGEKTKNGTVGMYENHKDTIESVAYMAKKKGRAVGILTSVSIDHATPASFYGHQPKRGMYYEIAMDGLHTGFDMFAGSGFLEPVSKKDGSLPEVYSSYEKAGYMILNGKAELSKVKDSGKKVLIKEREGADAESFAYAVDKCSDDLQVDDLVKEAIPFLTKRGGAKGFFMMVEGGKIDWSNHSNDVVSSLGEVRSFNRAIEMAYEFYKKYPNETLIVVTADHDTGAQTVITEYGEVDFLKGDLQKISQEKLEKVIVKMQKDGKKWADMQTFLQDNLGLWSEVGVSLEDEFAMRKAYGITDKVKEHYDQQGGELAKVAICALNKAMGVAWRTTDHSALPVPIYAVGAGANQFVGVMQNTDIAKKIGSFIK